MGAVEGSKLETVNRGLTVTDFSRSTGDKSEMLG
jgi:hypothetical protein